MNGLQLIGAIAACWFIFYLVGQLGKDIDDFIRRINRIEKEEE